MSNNTCAIELQNVSLSYRTRLAFFKHAEFKALDQVSFTVKKGETFGIIGNNGSGKSTLLKVLAGIYTPDGGQVVRHCKTASLLSLGLGFNNELTGRENAVVSAMLNGASKQHAMDFIKEVIEFSELSDSIDKPVKTYSSGMRARLGFSVALHNKVDLLLIDEVLGVGDSEFRIKAEAAMLSKLNSEQTVIFVSHSAGQVKKLCQNSIWLDKGRVRASGNTNDVFVQYQAEKRSKTN
ncbi:ABC transporter ATP-binding protein [Shewanella sp. Scap07]|uniref:ABC transporter ATP-binding protein n=1 Tax=Shewanella sp. Scap07 TaxID=2589987 RepID=UPI0015BF2E4A|nr:ABC transporter ATP-binding protein [Shewanella sp. Scap07]QLE86099.1 ABC transporter ATP-binding protein [Shewanella sp. Scap07]